jgi:hypothetical protein
MIKALKATHTQKRKIATTSELEGADDGNRTRTVSLGTGLSCTP